MAWRTAFSTSGCTMNGHHHAFKARLDIDVDGKAVFAESRHFERGQRIVCSTSRDSSSKSSEFLKRTTVKHSELAQQHACAIGSVRTSDAMVLIVLNRKVQVDLTLERLELHGGRKLGLLFQLNGGNLRRKQLPQALREAPPAFR